MANQCTKFEVSSLNCSKDILGGLKILIVSRDMVVAVINLHDKFEVSIFTHYEDMKLMPIS